MKRRHPSWRLWIRLSGSGEPIAGSDQWRKKKPAGKWVDITNCAKQCCSYPGELTSILVVPSSVTVDEGDTIQLMVIAVYDNGNVVNVTNDATYVSDDTDAATVSDTGLVTGVSADTTTIDVTFGSETETINVTVTSV